MPTPQRLPIVNGDDAVWGDILRQYLMKEHYNDDTDNAANGGHQKITIRAGSTAAGTAPLKFSSGSLMTTPEAGAMEFNNDDLYFTVTTDTERKVVALIPDANPVAGELFYLDSNGEFVSTGNGNNGDVLQFYDNTAYFAPPNSNLRTATKTASYGIVFTDNIILVNAASANITITLPDPADVGARYEVKRIDSSGNTCTVTSSNGGLIDGQASLTIDVQYISLTFISNGSAWYII